jgi:hypothetical protein
MVMVVVMGMMMKMVMMMMMMMMMVTMMVRTTRAPSVAYFHFTSILLPSLSAK